MNRKITPKKMIIALSALFILFTGVALFFECRYISGKLLQSNEAVATDIALLVKNNFSITDAEVSYMKSLTFNDMETDPINKRLMDVGNGVVLNSEVSNVYIVAPLESHERKLCSDSDTAEFLGYEINTELDGIWLLNGKINENGVFEVAQRDDIYRYTRLTESQRNGMEKREPFGEYSSDAWGSFITGYAPIYTVEGNFVGLLGIDMSPDRYQNSAQSMIFIMIALLTGTILAMAGLAVVFYLKYAKIREGQIKFDFYSRMSHDMRTLMNGVLGMAVLAENEQNSEVLHHYFETIESSGKYMMGLINDTLDFQQLKAGKLTLKPKIIRCDRLLDNLIKMIEPDAARKNIRFTVDVDKTDMECFVETDVFRFEQILVNITSNAFKFTPTGGKVSFSAENMGSDRTVIHEKFRISDTGIGISKEFIGKRLYEPFEQETSELSSRYSGSGLGLALAKNLVDMMGGHIEVESEQGVGTTFTVYLDLKRASRVIDGNALNDNNSFSQYPVSSLSGKRFLLCEDHPINAEITCKMIEKAGGCIETAQNGEIGLDKFKNSEPNYYDMVLMDIHMPVMNGFEATREIRALRRPDAKTIPIVALTANAYEEDIKNSRDAGMNAHLTKPVMPETLYSTLAEFLPDRSDTEE